ncbi:hypothetical protein [Novosphingobium sp.]|uniref:hypothetical protein n=1 Tax=Novosphingobium sp. TaxID=1874826 RepID=UPI0025D07C78|nr:hypothetical protein [Novosphingobium sp.]MCC6926463.1 hypothetical protein [Novosphingobium sp.]
MAISFQPQSNFTERRRHGRAQLGIAVAVRERSRSAMEVRLVDFSALGCRVDGLVVISRDAQLFVKLPGLDSQPARLAWLEGGRAGLEFDAQLHPAVAARFLPAQGSIAARTISTPADGYDPLLTRREQIMAGIAGSDMSPLQRSKKPTGLGLTGRIDRRVSRKVNHRGERRYSDAVPEGTQLAVEGELAKVVNVSSSGLRVHADLRAREIGDPVRVEFEGFPEMTGQLVWMNGPNAGISLPPQAIELFDRTG